MKICAVICEYNPFHNGHRYLLEQIRRLERPGGIVCLMSGNFTQRGDIALLDKHTRARHALEGGADAVIELPTVFATSSAETFARGAVHILSSIPSVETLAFGCESGTAESLYRAAEAFSKEGEAFRRELRTCLDRGLGFAAARERAARASEMDASLLASPNDILALEYTKAILHAGAKIKILPVRRVGGGYNEREKRDAYASASALRANREDEAFVRANVPDFVARDFPLPSDECYKIAAMTALSKSDSSSLRAVADCSEGLEHKLLRGTDYDSLVRSAAGKRYTQARIRRILLQNLLGIRREDIARALSSPLYLNLLAAKKDSPLLSELGNAAFPLVVRGRDRTKLCGEALRMQEIDSYADKIHKICTPSKKYPKNFKIV